MTVTPDQARMLTTLALACRPNGAKRWDSAGVMAAIKAIHHWSLAEAIAETVTAAADSTANSPGVIGKQGRRWTASLGGYVPETAPPGTRCTICGKPQEASHDHDGGYTLPTEKLAAEDVRERVAALKATLEPTAGPSGHRTLDDLAEANPELHERVDRVRQQIPNARMQEDELTANEEST